MGVERYTLLTLLLLLTLLTRFTLLTLLTWFILLTWFTLLTLFIRPGTRLFNNWRLIEYLKEATRSARLGTRSVLGAAGKVEI